MNCESLKARLSLEEIRECLSGDFSGILGKVGRHVTTCTPPALRVPPFDEAKSRLEKLVTDCKDTDEFWVFCTPRDTWQHLFGRAGIALVRDGKVVEAIITALN